MPTGRVAFDYVVYAIVEVPRVMGTLRIRNVCGLAQAFSTTEQVILAHFSTVTPQHMRLMAMSDWVDFLCVYVCQLNLAEVHDIC